MTTWTRLWAAGLLVGTTMLPRAHAQDLVTFRVDVVGGRATDDGKGGIRWLIDVPDPPSACVDIEIAVVLVSETGACVNDPSLCSGLERSLDGYRGCADGGLRCADGIDNDDDGLVDALDPECDGVATWRFSIEADESFVLDSVTTDDTAADIYPIAGPGRRDLCSLNKTDPVEASSNNGRWGAVSTVGLSLFGAVALDPVGEFVVLRLSETLSTSAPPTRVRVLLPNEPRLSGDGDPVNATVWRLDDTTIPTAVSDAKIELVPSSQAPVPFLRGDTDGNGEGTIGDGVRLLTFLVLGGEKLPCDDAADFGDNGILELGDAVAHFGFLFLVLQHPVWEET